MFIAREKTLLLSKLTQLIKIIFCYQREQTKDVPLNEDHFLITSLCHIVKIVKKKKRKIVFFSSLILCNAWNAPTRLELIKYLFILCLHLEWPQYLQSTQTSNEQTLAKIHFFRLQRKKRRRTHI